MNAQTDAEILWSIRQWFARHTHDDSPPEVWSEYFAWLLRRIEVRGRPAMRDPQPWRLSDRADPAALPLADRHYTRQAIGSPQFVPPGDCHVLLTADRRALWVSSWPLAQYVKHAWAGAWMCSCFRNEGAGLSSDLIRQAVALTRAVWPVPDLGMVTFVDPRKVRHKRDPGRCFRRAGFREELERTKEEGLIVLRLAPGDMPDADYSLTAPLLESIA